jgi:hypothetical protein
MKHVDPPSAWTNVIASLMAAGVSRTLAVGIVDILVNNKDHINPKIHHTPLILSKGQMVNTPKTSTKEFEGVAQIMPRLFLITEQLLAAPNLKRKHEAHQYCRHAALIGKESGRG